MNPRWPVSSRLHKILASGWLLMVLLLLGVFVAKIPTMRINNSIMDLLPRTSQKASMNPEIFEGFKKRLDQQLVWLVKATDGADAVAKDWVQALTQISGLTNITTQRSEADFAAWGRSLDAHKYALLDMATYLKVQHGQQLDWVLAQVYSPFAGVKLTELNHDPLLLMRAQLFAQQKNAGRLQMENGWLVSKSEDQTWYFIRAELEHSSYDIGNTKRLIAALTTAKHSLEIKYPSVQVLQRGTLFYSDYASNQATKDISTIGVASTLGIILLILLVFRSSRPLWLTLGALVIGVLTGITAVLLVFGEIHIITLVMCTSIVGVAIDYALLYLTERMVNGGRDTPKNTLAKLFMPLLGALISTAAAYFVLVFAPFAGMQQLAVFAVAGLFSVFITVVLWFPLLVHHLPVREPKRLFHLIDYWVGLWFYCKPLRFGLPLAITLFAIMGLTQLTFDDDVGKLQALPKSILNEDQAVSRLTGHSSEQRMIIVVGVTQDAAVARLELLEPILEQAVAQGIIGGYRSLPYRSLKTQQRNIALLETAYPKVIATLAQAGITLAPQAHTMNSVSPQAWLQSPLSDGWQLLWLTLANGESAIVVPLEEIHQGMQLQNLIKPIEGVYWVDRKTEISDLFAEYRYAMSILLLVALAVVALLFILRFRLIHGLQCILPISLALAMALATLGLLGISVNLFSILALILVLGIGIDYTFFFNNQQGQANVAMLTIFSAALISELTFGLLAFSHTTAIASFGIVLAVGIFTALLLAPLARLTISSEKAL